MAKDPENRFVDDDIVALRAKIQELDIVIANMPGNVYWLDRHNVYLGCNITQAKMLNFVSRHDIVGKTNKDIWSHQADELDQLNLTVMENGQPFLGEEIAIAPEGQIVYLSEKVPLRNAEGKVIGLLGVSLDITDRKRMERELKEAKEKAEIANQTKTEFIRNMEHDIRTPLCGIMSVVTHLQSKIQEEKNKEFLNDILIATTELLNYLDNIVEFSQINTGVVPLIKKEFNFLQVIKGIFNLESAAAKVKGLELIVEYPAHIPALVLGDHFRIHRILLNLVNNAIKFTHHGHVKIIVQLLEKQSDNQVILQVMVEDTGMGIDQKHHEMIFDKFTRCDPSNKGIYKGTGLGLWIVKHFVHDLNGHIEMFSELERGSVFSFTLPLKVVIHEECLDGI